MKKITADELKTILELHKKWLAKQTDGVRADLHKADLRWADLRWASLSEADLSEADLSGAVLNWADLSEADLSGAKGLPPICCPEKGSFIGFKKCSGLLGDCIVELEIAEDALRSSATTRKCRCSKAKVLSITNLDGSPYNENRAFSTHDPSFEYVIGKTVEVNEFNTYRWNECSSGIHFFITRAEAVNYMR